MDDAKRLQRLQMQAQGAKGQMAAISFANQFAGNQSTQLLEIRGLMLAQHNAVTLRMQADEQERAIQRAGHERFVKGLKGLKTDRSRSKGY